jgi:hypothetical protein
LSAVASHNDKIGATGAVIKSSFRINGIAAGDGAAKVLMHSSKPAAVAKRLDRNVVFPDDAAAKPLRAVEHEQSVAARQRGRCG